MYDHIEEAYQHVENYLNDPHDPDTSVGLLHSMCSGCECFCGIEKHDYSECRHKPCFKLFLGYDYAEWSEAWR